jgi:hypothetical protein
LARYRRPERYRASDDFLQSSRKPKRISSTPSSTNWLKANLAGLEQRLNRDRDARELTV